MFCKIKRPIGEGDRQVVADIVGDVGLMAQELERRRRDEAQIVEVRRGAQLGQDIEIRPHAQQLEPGIDEVGLPLVLRRAQISEDSVGLRESDPAAADQGNALPYPVTKSAPANCGFSKIASKPVEQAALGIVVAALE